MVGKIQTTLDDFIARYERDLKQQNVSLSEILTTIKDHDAFIKDIKPIYSKGMMAFGAAVLGTIGIATHWVWSHIKWGG